MNTRILLLILLMLSSSLIPAIAQTPEERIAEARGLALDSFYDDALLELDAISQEYAGSKYDAISRLHKAQLLGKVYNDYPGCEQLYLSVAQDFSNSRYSAIAELNLLDLSFLSERTTLSSYLASLDQLILSVGGVELSELRGNSIFGPTSIFNEQEQADFLAVCYQSAIGRILGSPDPISNTNLDIAEKLALAYLARFDDPREAATLLRNIEYYRRGGDESVLNLSPDGTAPVVEQVSTLLLPQQALEFLIEDGDITSSQLDVGDIKLSVDGIDLTNGTESVAFRENDKIVFLVSRLPDVEWAEGSHSGVILASDNNGNLIEHGFSFEVRTALDSNLTASKDTVLTEGLQYQNEGGNRLLTLEKVQGKIARSAVGFELDGISPAGLSRATLILTVNPNEHIDGWGNGRTVSVQALNALWHEGNGQSFGLQRKNQVPGNGSGATWFSPIDEDISNDFADSVVNWNGASASAFPPTAPPVEITNHSSGEVHFDVTTDVLNGADHGWLIRKDDENLGSKVSFYSKEGAAAAGNPDLAPRLLLEFGDSVASTEANSNSLLSHFGLGAIRTNLRPTRNGSELPSVKEILQQSPVAALAVEQILSEATRANPMLNLTSRIAYRSWLADSMQLAVIPSRVA